MKTTLRVAAMFALVLLLMAAAGQAGLEKKSGADKFKLYGQVVSLDKGAGTIQIDINAPDSLKAHSPLTVMTSAKTTFKQCEESDAPTEIDLGGIEAGRMVKVTGFMDGDHYMATVVIQY
jgi:hypothetical protein